MKKILHIYDFFVTHRIIRTIILLIAFATVSFLALRLQYEEDISTFLPFSSTQKQIKETYEKISGNEQIVIIFEGGGVDLKIEAIDYFDTLIRENANYLYPFFSSKINLVAYREIINYVYANIPYFALPEDFSRLDSLLNTPDFVKNALMATKKRFQIPFSQFSMDFQKNDPLSLFSPMISDLLHFSPNHRGFSLQEGYIFTEDNHIAIAFLKSPYGGSETKNNSQLVAHLRSLCDKTQMRFPSLSVRLTGAPVIAVENASCIKKDTALAILFSMFLISFILFACFKKDTVSILYILLTIAFGWLFGMATMTLLFGKINLIVLGMGSIIIGIAINYPLHLLTHRHYTPSVRDALKEVLPPLTIGNVTTIGAFLTLVPLQSPSLQQLGLFFSSTLVGTIIFTLFLLPPLIKNKKFPSNPSYEQQTILNKMPRPFQYALLAIIFLFTILFLFTGKNIKFDTELSHINYMNGQQKDDIAFFSSLKGEEETSDVYIVSPINDAPSPNKLKIDSFPYQIYSIYRWLPSEKEQKQRLNLWKNFWHNKKNKVLSELLTQGDSLGFNTHSFSSFINLLQTDYAAVPVSHFSKITNTFFYGFHIEDSSGVKIITKISTAKNKIKQLEDELSTQPDLKTSLIFDIHSLTADLAQTLARNFDVIGILCSVLVFGLLYFSFRSLFLATMAFLPMLTSWIWITGIMGMFGLNFNIVNIILATLIFGQGDDYTIFVVEGLAYERRTGKPILRKYLNGIYISAIIMLIGMGVLAFVRHPAIRSLGIVALIGMAVVVALANLLPPLIINIKRKL